MKTVLLFLVSALLLTVAMPPAGMAYDSVSAVAPQGRGFIGVGVIAKPDYEGSDETKATAAPFGKYIWASGRYISLGGSGGAETAGRVSMNLIPTDLSPILTFGPLIQYRVKRDDVENNKVDKMKAVDAATELGAFVGLKSGHFSAEVSFAADVSNEHDGQVVYIKTKYELMRNSKFMVNVGVDTSWADSSYMNTYFGVNTNNVGTSGLTSFNADSGFKDVGTKLTGVYFVNQTWALVGNVSYTRLLNDAKDSPLVEGSGGVGDKNQVSAVFAIAYMF